MINRTDNPKATRAGRALTLLSLTVAIAGCGGDDPAPTPPPRPPPPPAPGTTVAQCSSLVSLSIPGAKVTAATSVVDPLTLTGPFELPDETDNDQAFGRPGGRQGPAGYP